MTAREYENFDLLVESVAEERFRARVTQCSAGEPPAQSFLLPFSPLELENLLLRIDPARTGTRRVLTPRAEASAVLGAGLFEALFHDEILLAWTRSQQTARERGHGLRLRLRLGDAPQIAGLPWELLYDRKANHYIAKSDRTPVVRYLDVSRPPQPLAVHGPLRVLLVISSPEDLERLDTEREWRNVRDALGARSDSVVIDRLPNPTLGELQKWLRRHNVHVLHFIGHGDFDPATQEGVLAFCDAYGRSRLVSSEQLGTYVRDHDPLRLVVLNACRTATTDNLDIYSGVAQGLVQQEAPAVVAMQHPISDAAAIVFTSGFYGALADGEPVDQAISSVRKTLADQYGDEWATPVLFLRAGDGRIFDDITAEATPEVPRPAPRPLLTSPPVQPPRLAEPPARPAPRRGRRTRWIGVLAAAVIVAVAAVVIALNPVGGTGHGTAGSGAGPATSSTETRSTASTPSSIRSSSGSPSGFRVVSTGAAEFSGPATQGYRPMGRLAANSRVGLVCSIYAGQGRNTDFLWYRLDIGVYVNDQDVDTGGRRPVVNECTGTATNPSVGTTRPSPQSGPFPVLGSAPQEIYATPDRSSPTGQTVANDLLVNIVCHTQGPYYPPPPGGGGNHDWDQLSSGGWIPDSVLLSSSVQGSPAPQCPQPTSSSS